MAINQDIVSLAIQIGLILAAIFVLPPAVPKVERVRFTNSAYKWSLVVVLSILLLFNLASFLWTFSIRPLGAIVLQATLLIMIGRNYKHTRILIKLWCVMLIVSALLWLMSLYYAQEIDFSALANQLITLVVGLSFFVLADRYFQIIFDGYDKPAE
jgi:hypothetical protein